MIKSFRIFESNLKIEKICKNLGIKNFQIVDGGHFPWKLYLVNVDGDVDISNRGLSRIPVKFGRVEGHFNCQNNKLTSLEGAPQSVSRDFDCSYNKLTSLDGSPRSVGRNFYCEYNKLTSLEGAPQSVSRDFDCRNNLLTKLEGAPQNVGYFNCQNNQLTSLEGAPKNVGGYFDCTTNKLTTFRGIPEYSLNEDRGFYCEENPIYEIYQLFETPKCIDLINEFEVVGDGKISRVRLEEVFLELGLEIPKNLEFKNYKLVG